MEKIANKLAIERVNLERRRNLLREARMFRNDKTRNFQDLMTELNSGRIPMRHDDLLWAAVSPKNLTAETIEAEITGYYDE